MNNKVQNEIFRESKIYKNEITFNARSIGKRTRLSYATICRLEKDNRDPQIVSQGKFYAFCENKGIKFEN